MRSAVTGRRIRPRSAAMRPIWSRIGPPLRVMARHRFQGPASRLRGQQDAGDGHDRQHGGVPGGCEGVAGPPDQEGRQRRGGAAEERAPQPEGERQPAVAQPGGEQLGLSAVEDEAEYSFWHVLIRDMAYAQLPRASRSRRHRAAAEWIQDLAGDRVADRAELITYHFTQAVALARAAREPDIARLEASTRDALVLAGDSALGLDLARAEAYYRQALELCPPGTPGRPRLLAKAGRAAFQAGRVAEAASIQEEAVAGFAAEGDLVGQGEALNRLSSVLWNQGEARGARDALVHAVELLERAGPGPELCSAYAQMAMDRGMSGHPQEALGWADKALALADELGGLPEKRLRALDARGVARGDLGDLGGMEDLRAALAVGLEIGAGYDTAVSTTT